TVAVDATTTCTATVTDTAGGAASTPTGTVSWASDGTGSFSAATCTLDAGGKCSVDYTPTAIGTGTHTITGDYGGDAKHGQSTGTTTVTVRPGPPASVSVSPANATNTAGEEHCVTATVKDAYGNTAEAGVTVYFSVTGANPRSVTPR